MKNIRMIVVLALVTALVLAGYLTLRGFEVFWVPRATVKEVPRGHQEIAWIAPATSDETWERLVAAIRYLVQQWPERFAGVPVLQANFDKAFLDLTADVPEVGLYFQGREDAVLWLRWYKLSSGVGTKNWVTKLVGRERPPLAILGGDTSDRAVTLASALQDRVNDWGGPAPLLLITTATADLYYPSDYVPGGTQDDDRTKRTWPKLMEIYKGRAFRFTFTNTRMAEAILEFLGEHPEVWLPVKSDPAYLAGVVANGTSWGCLGGLAAGSFFQTQALYTLAWLDDRYSLDLADRFAQVFAEKFAPGPDQSGVDSDLIQYGVGDYNVPNPPEARAAGQFLANTALFRRRHQMLALPTSSQRARRFLRTLCGSAPADIRNLVVISCDAITFNHIFRDRDLAWNILDMPVPLVLFSHRNPISAKAGFGHKVADEDRIAATGTQDLLLYVDVFQTLVQAAFQNRRLLADPDILKVRLRQTTWHRGQAFNPGFIKPPAGAIALFNAIGDRHNHTGEHVVWLRPEFAGDLVLMQAAITVWRVPATETDRRWRLAGPPLHVTYNTAVPQGNHGAD